MKNDWNEFERRAGWVYRHKRWIWMKVMFVVTVAAVIVTIQLAGCDPVGPSAAEVQASHAESRAATDELVAALAMPAGPDREAALAAASKRVEASLATVADLERRAREAEKTAAGAQAAAGSASTLLAGTGIGGIASLAMNLFLEYRRRKMAEIAAGLVEDQEYTKAHVPSAIYDPMMTRVKARQATAGHQGAIVQLVQRLPANVTKAAEAAGTAALASLTAPPGDQAA